MLEDNLRTPSGFAYCVAARQALPARAAARAAAGRVRSNPLIYELLGARAAAAGPARRPGPTR